MIRKVGTKYVLYSKKTGKRLSKPGSKASVAKREAQVQYFKNKAFDEDVPRVDISASSKTLQTQTNKKNQASRINNTDAYKGHDGEDFTFPELQEGPLGMDRGGMASARKGKLEKAEKGTPSYMKWIQTYRYHHPVKDTIERRYDIAKHGTKPMTVDLDLIDKKIDSLVRDNLYAKEGLRSARPLEDTKSTRVMIANNERKLDMLNALKDAHADGHIDFKEGVPLHHMPDDIRSVFKAKDGYRLVSVKVNFGDVVKGVDAFKVKVSDIYQEFIQRKDNNDIELLYPSKEEVLFQIKKGLPSNDIIFGIREIMLSNVEGFIDFRPLSIKAGDNWGELTRENS